MNWGRSIFIFLLVFVIANVAFLLVTMNWDWSLVEEDYYPKELRHEELLVKKRNYNALSEKMTINLSAISLDIRFPEFFKGKRTSGQIHVYRPSDQKLDYLVPVRLDSTMVQSIPRQHLRHGNYIVKVEWYESGTGYYKEQELFIP